MSGTTSRRFEAIISVLDRTGGPLAVIATRLRAIAGMSGMQRITASALGVQRSFAALAGTATRFAAIAGGAAAGVGVGLVAAMNAAVDAGGALSDLSARLGMSVEDIQSLGFAFEQGGVSGEQFTGAMERLNRGIADVAAGRNQDLAGLFTRLGISVRDSNGQVRSAAAILPQLAQAMQRNENGAVRTRIAMTAFGRAGGPLVAVLAQGTDALREQQQRWRELNGQITGGNVDSLDAVGDSMNEVRHSLIGVRDAIAVRLTPVLAPLFSQLASWVAANRDLVATKVAEWVQGVAEWLRQIDFGAVREGLERFLTIAERVFNAIGGWRGVIFGVIAVITGPLMLAITTLTAALLTNPIGAAVAAIAAAAALIYLHWDGIVGFFQGIWDGISAGWDRFVNSEQMQETQRIFAAIARGIMEVWEPIGDFFTGLWSGISGAFTAGWAVIGPIVRAVIAGAEALASLMPGNGTNPAFSPEAQAERARNFGGRGRAGGFYDGPALDPDTGQPAYQPLYRPQSGGGATAAPQGEVRLHMTFDNVPPGARVQAETRGSGVQAPELDVGYATMGAF
jgi:hypothetical protein